jgi:hypothetical protein
MTGDKGPNSLILVREVVRQGKQDEKLTPLLLKTIFDPHKGRGVVAATFSPDSKYLYTLGDGKHLIGARRT